MKYEKLLNCTFSEARERYADVKQAASAKRILTIRGSKDNDTVSDDSDVIVFYDVVEDSYPLLIIERVNKKYFKKQNLKMIIKRLQGELKDAYIVRVDKNVDTVDVVIVKRSIYDAFNKKDD